MENYKSLTKDELNSEFISACQKGDLEKVKYLLISPELEKHADIHIGNDYGFGLACYNGHLDMVRYLMTSPDLKEHANIHSFDDVGFRWACYSGHLEVVKYLLNSPELREHANIHAWDDYGFKHACSYGNLEIVKYLIFEIDIEKTDKIKEFLTNPRHQYVENLFKIRDLNKELENKLTDSDNKRKNKI